MVNYPTQNDDSKELAYDLRQIYAKLVGDHLQDVADARKIDNYPAYINSLDDLHTIIKHKFKKIETDEAAYQKLYKKSIDLCNQYPTTFLGQRKDSTEKAIIENSLKEIEMFLYSKMEEANMFGSKYREEDDGL